MKIVWSENLETLLNSWKKYQSGESVSLQIRYSISKVEQATKQYPLDVLFLSHLILLCFW